MATDPHKHPLARVASLLSQAIQAKKSGVLALATEENRSAYFVIEQGVIRNIVFQKKRGIAALEGILEQQITRCKFNVQKNTAIVEKNPEVKASGPVLAMLRKRAGVENTSDISSIEYPAREVLPIVIEEAGEYLGPIAQLVCKEHFAGKQRLTPSSLRATLQGICREFSDPAQAEAFKEKALGRIGRELQG